MLGTASESVLPYSVGARVEVLGQNGAKAYSWQAPGTVTNTTAYENRVAVFVKGGHCYVIGPPGVVTETYAFTPGTVQEFALAGVGLVVQLPHGKVEIRKGAAVRTVALPAAARMLDYAQGLVLYRLGSKVRVRRVSDGKDAYLRTAAFATLDRLGLSYATGRKVSSVAWVNVTAALND